MCPVESYRPGHGKRHGDKAEKKLSKRLGAQLTPASGALDGAKADMVVAEFRTESKSTVKDSFRIQLADLCKVTDEAAEMGEVPALAVQFVSPDGRLRKSGGWIMVPEYVFAELLDGEG